MTRLFHLSGDTPLAIRTLKLYVQIVGKAYQASKEGVNEDVDSDDLWVETLVFGIRMVCRYAASSDDPEIIDDVRYAGTLIEKARSRLNRERKLLVASVFLAEGVWNTIMALKGAFFCFGLYLFLDEHWFVQKKTLTHGHNVYMTHTTTSFNLSKPCQHPQDIITLPSPSLVQVLLGICKSLSRAPVSRWRLTLRRSDTGTFWVCC